MSDLEQTVEAPKKEPERRIRIIKVYPDLLMKLFTLEGKPMVVIDGIPADAEFRGFNQDWSTNTMNIFMEHPSFDVVPQGQSCPMMDVTIRSLNTAEEAAPYFPVKPLPLPSEVTL